jgi:predicted SnoaL-like aldol condensation-catalyzing enzyme
MKDAATRRYLTAVSLLCFSTALMAGLPARAESEAEEAENLRKGIYCMKVLEVEFDVEKAGRECFAENYVEHAPHVPDGKEGVLAYFEGQLKKFPNARMEIKRAGADGDLVWMHIHFQPTPESRGSTGMHAFRMKDGKFVEHWGVGRPVPETTVSGNSVF